MAIIYNAIGKLALRIDETNKRIDSLGTRIDDLSNDMRVGFQDIHRMFNEHLRREHHLTGIDT
ncbi:MAG: hypothetical protein M1483_05115 [Actinobacteria bacterium]|nr:hypothetical protein [Actinomycetota bacterium]